MLKLIKCEFLKLKRKKFIPLIILAAFLFPIPLTYLMTTPSMMERYTDSGQMLSMDYLTWCWDMVSSFYCPALSE